MLLGQKHLDVSSQGHLTVSGADCVSLAERFGTPLYVMSEDAVRESCRGYASAIERELGGRGRALYASKAFCCKEMCRIATSEGLGLDVVSGGEMYTALSAGVDPSLICFHGNNKTDEELRLAAEAGVGWIAADNLPELRRLDRIAGELGKKARVILRIKPGIEAHTHKYIRTGQYDSKFGFALETGEALEAAAEAELLPNIELDGLHCHIGSQIFESEPFAHAPEIMMDFMYELSVRFGREVRVLNLGGGFGIRYTESDRPLDTAEYIRAIADSLKASCARLGMRVPYVCVEPGRSIAGPAGVTLYTVGSVKEIPGVRTYAAVDGGMTDNPRYALYQSEYTVLAAARAGEPKDSTVTLAGRCCETGDLLGENLPVQTLHEGDIAAVLSTGAYNYSMASNYNRVPRAAVVFVRGGEARVAVKRETWEDMARLDV